MRQHTIFIILLNCFLLVGLHKGKADGVKLNSIGKEIKQLVANDSILNQLYYRNNYEPLWVGNLLDMIRVKAVISVLAKSDEHGLSPEFFSLSHITHLFDSIQHRHYRNKKILKTKLLKLELLLSKSVVDYSVALQYGYTNPNNLYPDGYHIPIKCPDSTYYETLYRYIIRNPTFLFKVIEPKDDNYVKLQKQLMKYSLYRKVEFITIPIDSNKATYKVNDTMPDMALLLDRLKITGELPMDFECSGIVSSQLLDAINAFRRANSLFEKGEIDTFVIAALNRPFEYYYSKILINMERYRWKESSKDDNNKHIRVNVAAGYLMANDSLNNLLTMKVCVGKPSTKTPLLQSKISYINFNPTWNVPMKISKNEICAAMKKDATYIQRHNMRLYKRGEEVDVTEIDWKNINCRDFNYIIKQDPGDDNSLGRVKFMFSNPFAVYLHDTPTKSAFKRNNRAVSHGCVRVERPLDLVFFCVSATDSLLQDRIRYTIDEVVVSQQAKELLMLDELEKLPDIFNLKEKIPLYIDYYTVYTLPNDGALYFATDVYGYDEALRNVLLPDITVED